MMILREKGETMSDYIKREDAIDYLTTNMNWFDADGIETSEEEKRADITELVNGVPSADVAPIRRGHWIYDQCDIVCSECGTAFSDEVCYMMRSDASYHEPKHCLWCGAIMEGGTK